MNMFFLFVSKCRLLYGAVLNTSRLLCRRYEDVVTRRDYDRELYRRDQRRRGRRTRFAYPRELSRIPDFQEWVLEEVTRDRQIGAVVDPRVMDTARGPLNTATAYKSMYAFGNHYRVLSSELPLKTRDSGVAATFKQVCRNGRRDNHQVNADVEYAGHIEKILELNYRRHCLVVLVCDFVKANYSGVNATIKRDKWGFTLANYKRRYGCVSQDSFAFPRHCEQVFFSTARESPGWRAVLRKKVRGRRILPTNDDDEEAKLFQTGEDEDFEGLNPDRDVGEQDLEPAATGEDVVLEPVIRLNQVRRGARGGRGRVGRATVGRGARPNTVQAEEQEANLGSEDEAVEEERLNRQLGGRRRPTAAVAAQEQRNVRKRPHAQGFIESGEDTSIEEEDSFSEHSTSGTFGSASDELEY